MILTIKRTPLLEAVPTPPVVPEIQVQQEKPQALPRDPVQMLVPEKGAVTGKIQTTSPLALFIGEEMMIQAEVIYQDGSRSAEFAVEGLQKDLLEVKADRRTLKALKAGKAEVAVFDPAHPHIRTHVQVDIRVSTIAIIELEIEYKK